MKPARNLAVPQAREDDVVVQELANEVLVYDLNTHKGHCLNQTAAAVWRHCDGTTTVPELTAIVSRELSTAVDEELVWTALDRLGKAGLLQARIRRPGISRRDAVKWALATAAAVPLVSSITAPLAAQGASCVPEAQGCKPNGNNEAGMCLASSECCSCCCHTNTGLPADAHCTSGAASCLPG
jgi:hypothetical protein